MLASANGEVVPSKVEVVVFGGFSRLARRWAPATSLFLVVVTVMYMVVTADGYAVKKLDLHDTGIWISNDADGFYGRLNKAARGLDATVGPPGQRVSPFDLDVLQDGDVVVGWDRRNAKLTSIDTATATNDVDTAIGLAPQSQVQLRGGTLAVMDRSGKVWATRYDTRGAAVDLLGVDQSQKPLADLKLAEDSVESSASLAVGVDGAVYAGAVSGAFVTIPVESGRLGKPVESTLDGAWSSIQVTAVGSAVVALDAGAGRLQVLGSGVTNVHPDPKAQLQEPGPAAAQVLLATSSEFTRVALSGGGVEVVDSQGGGAPTRPVRLGTCAFGAWAGSPGRFVQACEDQSPVAGAVDRDGALVSPVFRVNHNLITLNDTATGRAFDLDTRTSLDNWVDTRPKAAQEEAQHSEETLQTDAKPKANDDALKARPDRTTVLHVLDNDTDTGGGLLCVRSLGLEGVPEGVQVEIAPDGQTLKFFMPDGVASASFRYTITNGNQDSEGRVEVTNAGTGNTSPHARPGYVPPTYTAPSFGNLSIPVGGDWRDDEGDPVAVVSATDEKGAVVPVTADGRIEFTAGREEQDTAKTITYQVTDGVNGASLVSGTVQVSVLSAKASAAVSPVAAPDAALGVVGKPVSILPLANDVPGADPRNPQARLLLAGEVAAKADLDVRTDVKTGQVVVTASRVGTYFLDYEVGFGSSAFAKGLILVTIQDAGAQSGPVAMPDQAAVHGQAAVMVDVLANDYDPAGALLTVQSATPVDAGQVQVAVISGRFLRIVPLVEAFTPNPQVVHYTISNGGQESAGDVVVTQLPGVAEDQPLVRDDFAVVRDGDSVLIPVLANDTSLSGSPLTLVTNIAGMDSPGMLRVIDPAKRADESQGDVGSAFVHNGAVRYVAPAVVAAPRQVQIEYVAATGAGNTAVGHVTVTINPQPASPEADQAPVPQTVEMRVTSGARVAIPIPTTGQDPDGDSVTVLGIGSAPALGRVTGFSPTSITYEAYPTAGLVGTDTFSYVVVDRYGRTASAGIRVAVTPPGQTQPPVAIDDGVTARPGAQVQVNLLGNDLYARDDAVTVAPLAGLNASLPDGVSLATDAGPLVVKAPPADGQPVVVLYALTGNGGTGPSASVMVTSKEGYKNPPVIADKTATIDGKVATVDVLEGAWDPDGDTAALQVTMLASPEGLTVSGGRVTIPLLDHAQVIPFKVTDGDGASNGAVIYVPPIGTGVPVLRSGALIEVPQNGTVALNVADYVTSPRTGTVKLASATLSASPSDALAGTVNDPDRLTLTAKNDYVGPGAIVVEVMDAASATEPGVLTALIAIPVQVGPKSPVLRCPTDTQTIVQGGEVKNLDITTLCHVWSPTPEELPNLVYTATWSKPLDDVSVVGNAHKISVQAGSNAREDTTGTLTIGVANSPAKTADIPIRVLEAPKPTMQSQTITDIKQGTPVTVQLGLTSALLKPEPTIVKVEKISGPESTESHQGTTITITPAANVHGEIVYAVTASDLADLTRTNRYITRNITIVVYGPPDAPGAPQPGQTVQSRAVALTWTPPASNGAAIDSYEIKCSTGQITTSQAAEANITGLTNGTPVTFQVRAHNKGGWSDWGPTSQPVVPDEVPGAPTGITASNPQDGSLTLTWTAPVNGGTPVKIIHIAWQGGGKDLSGNPTTTTITGLDNNTQYTFTVWAENNLGPGPNGQGLGQSSGKPQGLSVDTPTPGTPTGNTTNVQVSWNAADPNGPGPLTYTATRNDGKTICTATTATSCTDDTVTYDGTTHSYTVTATNATGAPHSTTATSPPWQATGTPDTWAGGSWTVEPTGTNGTIHLTITSVPIARGATSTITVLINGSPNKTMPGTPGATDIGGLTNGTNYSVSLKQCNESTCGPVSGGITATPFGPLAAPTVTYTSMNGTVVSFTVTASGNGANATLTINADKSCNGTGSYDTGAGSINRSVSCDVGYSASATVTATLSDPARGRTGGSDSATSATTGPKPNPVATFSLTGTKCSQVWAACPYPNWVVQRLHLTGWNPNSTVSCYTDPTSPGLSAWSGTFAVDGSGNWGGPTMITPSNSSGYLYAADSSGLLSTSSCRQN